MVLSFNIKNGKQNTIIITGLTQETNEYLPEDSWIPKYYNYRYSDCITINIVNQITTQGEELFKVMFNKHDIWLDESIVELPHDGLYSIYHIVVPTVEWLERIKKEAPSMLDEYKDVYVSDGGIIYRYSNSQYSEVEPQIISEINTYKTTISKAENFTFSIWNLQKCYIYLCNEILSDKVLRCTKHINQNTIFNRDLVWMTLNIIKYYIGFKQVYEAQRVLEQINYCHGVCKTAKTNFNNQSYCGCS